MARSFSSLYVTWLDKGHGRNQRAERELVRTYRKAWELGGPAERDAVLHFIALHREAAGFDLVSEGLRSSDPELARTAAAVAFSLLTRGFDLGPFVRKDLEDFGSRFPEWDVFSWAALAALDDNEKRGR